MQYITFRLQTDCNQTFHSPSFSIKYVLYFLYFLRVAVRRYDHGHSWRAGLRDPLVIATHGRKGACSRNPGMRLNH